jgi:MFS family permease
MDLKTKLIFWQTWVATFFFFGGFYILTAQLPLYLAGVKIPDWQIGFISGVFGVSSLICRPFMGLLCDRIGTYQVIIGSVLCFLVGALALNLSSDLIFLVVLRIFQAIGYVGFTTAGTTIIVKLLDLSVRDRWLAWYGAAANVAVTLTPLALDLTLAKSYAEFSFYLAALFAGVGLLLVLNLRESGNKPVVSANLKIYGILQYVALPAVLAFIAGTNFGAFLQFTPLLAKEGVSTGFIYTAYGVGIILVRIIIWNVLSVTLQKLMLPLGFGFSTIGLITFAFSPSYEYYLFGAAILAFGSGLQTQALIIIHVNSLPATMQGRAVALYYFGFDAGIGLGTWLITPFLAIFGLRGLFAAAALTGLVGLIIWLGFKDRIGVKNAN